MLVRSLRDLVGTERDVDWGRGKSYRFLIEKDGMGFTMCHTIVRAGTEAKLQYKNHLEACYCISGEGEVQDMKGTVYPIRQGDMYILNQHDEHYLRGGKIDLHLISIFNPPLRGDEKHNLTEDGASSYS